MRILNAQEVLLQPTDTVFGPSKIQAISIFLICLLIFVPASVMTFLNGQWIGFALFTFIGAIVLLATGIMVIDTFKKDSWRIAVRTEAILLKADITDKDSRDILEIQFREITSLRKLREQYYVYRKRKKHYRLSRVTRDVLDIQLAPDSYEQLAQMGAAKAVGLEINTPDRLLYHAGSFMVSVDKVIEQIQNACRVEEQHTVTFDKPDKSDKQQVDDYLLFLARRGENMAARRLAYKAFGYDHRGAKNYIADLLQNAL